jgi:hypothetical protein
MSTVCAEEVAFGGDRFLDECTNSYLTNVKSV